MNYREQIRRLKDAGFWLKRNGTKHEIWTNGREEIAISHGGKGASPRTIKSFLSKLRKAKIQI